MRADARLKMSAMVGRGLRRWWSGMRKRFVGVTRSEKWGYGVWGAMGAVIAVPELSAVGKGCDFPWPTISTTVGHLQELWPVVALVPVALIVMGAYFVFTLMPSSPPRIADDDHLIVRTGEGRLTKVPFTSYDQLSTAASADWSSQDSSRKPLPSLPYFGIATLAVIAGWVRCARNRRPLRHRLHRLLDHRNLLGHPAERPRLLVQARHPVRHADLYGRDARAVGCRSLPA